MSRFWKAGLWIGGALAVLAAIILLTGYLFLLTGFKGPTFDQSVLKALKAESLILMAAQSGTPYATIPKSRWPRVVASLEPKEVIVFSDGVDILIMPFFDGGWGYFIPRSEQKPPKESWYLKLDQGVYWHHPY